MHKYAEMWQSLPSELGNTKRPSESCRPLADYVGNYYYMIHNFFIQISSASYFKLSLNIDLMPWILNPQSIFADTTVTIEHYFIGL